MSDKPAWRRTYDAVETTVTPWVEAVVHTGEFASTYDPFGPHEAPGW